MNFWSFLIATPILFVASTSAAQIDLQGFLNREDTAVSSGRYQIKKSGKNSLRQPASKEDDAKDSEMDLKLRKKKKKKKSDDVNSDNADDSSSTDKNDTSKSVDSKNSDSSSAVADENSGTVKKRKKSKKQKDALSDSELASDVSTDHQDVSSEDRTQKSLRDVVKDSLRDESHTGIEAKAIDTKNVDAKNSETKAPPEPSITEQVRLLGQNQTEKVLQFYKEQLHPDDIRQNKMEIQLSPTFIYSDARSNYSYREYSYRMTALELKGRAWLTPSIGLQGVLLQSTSGDLPGDYTTHSHATAKLENYSMGILGRRSFGFSRLSNQLLFGIHYFEDKLNVGTDSTSRARLKSGGLNFSVGARLPSSADHAYVVEFSYAPRLAHSEATSSSITSGNPADSSRLSLSIGGEFKFKRTDQFKYELITGIEQNSFTGSAASADPVTATTPSNVGVTTSTILLRFGYQWAR